MKFIVSIVAAFILIIPSFILAETKEIVAEGAYNMGDGETPTVAESRALLQAKRTAVEEAGTYVESYSKTRNFQLTADEIQVLASGVMEVEVLEKKRTVVGDGFNFWIKIKARVSTDKMEEMAKRVKERSVVEDYKKIQAAYDKSQKEIEELKRQLAGAKGEKEKKKVEVKIANDERLFQANEWFEKGVRHYKDFNNDEAIKAFTNVIQLNPNFAKAYILLGDIYSFKGYYDIAIEAVNKAIAIDPYQMDSYSVRGRIYHKLGKYSEAIEDYNKSLAIDPNSIEAYKERAESYLAVSKYDEAINNYSKAITIDPDDAFLYVARGSAYFSRGQYDLAIADYSKAISMIPGRPYFYTSRGDVYSKIDQFEIAIVDYSKAIDLFSDGDHSRLSIPYLSDAYNKRGNVYYNFKNDRNAMADFQKACDLGNESGCKNLQRVLNEH